MARDRQLPSFLAVVSKRHGVPVNATFVTAAVSLVVGLYMAARDDGITLLSTLVNFGALSAFLVLHLAVINHFVRRQGSRDWLRHLVYPLIGFGILLFVVMVGTGLTETHKFREDEVMITFHGERLHGLNASGCAPAAWARCTSGASSAIATEPSVTCTSPRRR